MKAVLTAAAVVGALLVGSCHSAPLTRPESAVPKSITLERTTCFGMCPAYRLTLDRRGAVSFVSRNTDDSGRMGAGRVAPSMLDSLYARAIRIGFFALPDTLYGDRTFCSRWVTDQPDATVTIDTDAGKKTVADSHGCLPNSPAAQATVSELRAFEDAIDTVTVSSRWIQPNRR